MTNPTTSQKLDEMKYKIAEQMFLKLGIDMGRTDTQYPILPAKDRDKFLETVTTLFSDVIGDEVLKTRIDELSMALETKGRVLINGKPSPASHLEGGDDTVIYPSMLEARLQSLKAQLNPKESEE